jgi:hypothetical protein
LGGTGPNHDVKFVMAKVGQDENPVGQRVLALARVARSVRPASAPIPA